MRSPVDTYLGELWRKLRWRPRLAKRVVREFGDHLSEATARGVRSGMSREDAENAAVRQMGSPASVAERYRSSGCSSGSLLLAASVALFAIAVWLGFVTIRVLPTRDPEHVTIWRVIAMMFGLYAGGTASFVVSGSERAALRRLLTTISLAAIAFGTYVFV